MHGMDYEEKMEIQGGNVTKQAEIALACKSIKQSAYADASQGTEADKYNDNSMKVNANKTFKPSY